MNHFLGKFWKKIINHKILSFFIAIVIFGGGYYFYGKLTTTAVPPRYVLAQVQKGTLVSSVTGSGQVSASNQTNVQAQVSGVVSQILVANNQAVKKGQTLIRLDTINDERSVRNAQANLDNAQLSLQTLLAPASTSSVLQSQQTAIQSQQNYENSQNNLVSDYGNAYNDVSNAFIDLPGVMTGLNNVIYNMTINKSQWDIDVYANMISGWAPNTPQFEQSSIASYQSALSAYNQSLADFKNSTINSSTSTIESLLAETNTALRTISVANSNLKNFLDLVNNTLQANNSKVPSQLTLDETSVQGYIATVNSHIATIIQIQNSIQSDKNSIISGKISVEQSDAAYQQLQSGPTQLQIQQQQLAVTQAENALSDAKENLNNDYITAPFDGVVTNITARAGQPASGTLAVLVSNAQLAQATLNEVDVVNVKLGQQATVTFDALPNITLTGKVVEVDTLGTVVQGVVSYNAQVALDIPNPDVKPGMSDTVSIITGVKQDVLLVPNEAVKSQGSNQYVQVLELPQGETLSAQGVTSAVAPANQPVQTGISNDTMTEITSGLAEGQYVVTRIITAAATTAAQTPSAGGAGIRIPGITGGGRGG